MAMAKLTLVALLLAFFAISTLASTALAGNYNTDASRYGPRSLKKYQCPSECNRRCSRTQYRNACLLFCNKCCNKCLCVPPGFYGNKGVCPCYNNWKTQQGGPKCP